MADAQIFVVDDEPVIAFTLAAILEQNGFSARAFTSPLRALESARNGAPDLLISDVSMPELSGVNLAIQFRVRHPMCRVRLFSGEAATSDLLGDAERRGYDFTLLAKPVHPTDLLAVVGGTGMMPRRRERRRRLVTA